MGKRSILVMLAAFGLTLPASPAAAAVPCALSGTTLTLTFDAAYANFWLYLNPAATYELRYDLNGFSTTHTCDNAARDLVTKVVVNGDATRNDLTVDIGGEGGPFNTNTTFSAILGGGESDYFRVFGTEGNDVFRYGHYTPTGGTLTLDWDNDGVPEVDIFSAEVVVGYGAGGDDTITGAAGGNFGASKVPIDFWGGEGNDLLTGGLGNDAFFGEDGRDAMWGGRGADEMRGQAGRDKMWGQAGRDKMWGQAGKDKMWGGPAGDRLFGGGGADNLLGQGGADRLFGGGGSDKCNGGAGADSQSSCEIGAN